MFRKLRQHFGISAPKLAVRTHIGWPLRILLAVLLVGGVGALGWWGYDTGRLFAGFNRGEAEEIRNRLQVELALVQDEANRLRTQVARLESELKVIEGVNDALLKQSRALQADNTELKEELTFLQKLLSGPDKEGAVEIQRFRVERDGAEAYRYRLMLVQPGAKAQSFSGQIQFRVSLLHDGRKLAIVLPDDQPAITAALRVSFIHYQRVEGTFRVPTGSLVESIQARLFETGAAIPKVTQTLKVS